MSSFRKQSSVVESGDVILEGNFHPGQPTARSSSVRPNRLHSQEVMGVEVRPHQNVMKALTSTALRRSSECGSELSLLGQAVEAGGMLTSK